MNENCIETYQTYITNNKHDCVHISVRGWIGIPTH